MELDNNYITMEYSMMLLVTGPKHSLPELQSSLEGEYMTHIVEAIFRVCQLDLSMNPMKMGSMIASVNHTNDYDMSRSHRII